MYFSKRTDGLLIGKSSRRFLLQFTLVLIGVWSAAIYEVYEINRDRFAQETNSSANLVEALSAYTEASFSNIKNLLSTVGPHLKDHEINERFSKEGTEELVAIAGTSKIIASLATIDSSGVTDHAIVANGNGGFVSTNKKISVEDREYYKYFANSWNEARSQETLISTPVRGRVSGNWMIPIVQARKGEDGSFQGLVIATFLLKKFQNLYSSFNLTDVGILSLLRSDGIVLVRLPFNEKLIGKNILPDEKFRKLYSKPVGTIERSTVSDGQTRLISYRKLENFPLVIVSMKLKNNIIQSIWMHQFIMLVIAVVASILLLLFWRSLSRQVTYQEKVEDNLRLRVDEKTRDLKASEQRLSLALTSSKAGYWVRDVINNHIYWSDENTKLLGYELGEVEASFDNWAKRIHPDDGGRTASIFLQNIANKSNINLEYQVLLPNGDIRWLNNIGNPVFNSKGEVTLFTGIQIDISDRKETESALQESEERFRSISESSTIAMIISVNEDGEIITWNKAAEQSFGYSKSEAVGHPLTDFMPERYRSSHQLGFKRAVQTEEHHIISKTVELHGLKKNGEEFPIELSLGMWKQRGKKHFSAVMYDITNRKKINDELIDRTTALTAEVTKRQLIELSLIKAKEEAEKANQTKSQFLASMSHELRTPLNAVLGFAQMLQFDPKNPLSDAQNLHVESILEGGNHLLDLVNQILDLAKIEADQISVSLSKVNVFDVVEDCLNLMSPLANSKGIQVINKIKGKGLPDIRTDNTRFKQVLVNLLSNAVKYNKDEGQITLDAQETHDGYLHLSVADTGQGIAKENYSGVFEIFNRLDIDPMIAKEGTGIGLPVTKMLAERLSGRVGFDSEVDVGSTFWVELPLASNEDVLIWADNLRVGVDAIDKDHQTLISLANRISYEGIDEAEISVVVGELVNYTRFHFRREEAIMEVCGYPDLERHRNLHKDLINHVSEMADKWLEDPNPEMLIKLRKFMREWLIDHVVKVDKEIAKYTKGKSQEIAAALKTTRFMPPSELFDEP